MIYLTLKLLIHGKMWVSLAFCSICLDSNEADGTHSFGCNNIMDVLRLRLK